jgi:hypothetical protein
MDKYNRLSPKIIQEDQIDEVEDIAENEDLNISIRNTFVSDL